MNFTEEQVEEMTREAQAIADLIKAIDNILNGPAQNRKSQSQLDKQNVLYIDFGIGREFLKAQKLSLKLPQLLAIYHDWAFRAYQVTKSNKANLQNPAIRSHLEKNYNIVYTVLDLMPQGT